MRLLPKSTRLPPRTLAALTMVALAAAGPILLAPAGRQAAASIDRCAAPAELTRLELPLLKAGQRLAEHRQFTVVALGSSSTEGIGASRPENSYPSRLAQYLMQRLPGVAIRVVNRGVGGETADKMLTRIQNEVLPEHPDLVIWQLGTNTVLRDEDPEGPVRAVRSGIKLLKAAGIEVMLMDLQYAPAVLMHGEYRDMLGLLAAVAREEEVPIFHRFSLMLHWVENGNMTFKVMLAPDHLHMSDASYDCLARELGGSILAAAEPPERT